MDVHASLPPDFEWYENQIAGHHPSVIRNGLRQIGILKYKNRDDIILKLVQEGERGQREVELYQRVEETAAQNGNGANGQEGEKVVTMLVKELYPYLPRFHGCTHVQLSQGDQPKEFLQIEDITQLFKWPCIMDVKVGRVTYDPQASEEKKLAEDSKSPLQKVVGFRILGYRNQTGNGVQYRDRVWGRERTQDNVEQAFAEYLTTVRSDSLAIVDAFLYQLGQIQDWFSRQGIFHFYASSLLFVYEGHPTLPPIINLRMIDFSHVFYRPNGLEKDENYLYGLVHIIKLFRNIRNNLSPMKEINKQNGMIMATNGIIHQQNGNYKGKTVKNCEKN